MKTIANVFDANFEAVTKVTNFNPSWYNGTGYFDHAVNGGPHSVTLEVGEMSKSLAAGDDGRKLIFVGTDLGTIVVFQRFTDDSEKIVSNADRRLEQSGLLGIGSLISRSDLQRILGNPEFKYMFKNCGVWIRELKNLLSTVPVEK
jgi:hypothetical protein